MNSGVKLKSMAEILFFTMLINFKVRKKWNV